MPVTDAQRDEAWSAAFERQDRHTVRGDRDYHISKRHSGQHSHYLGLLGEFELTNRFGGSVDLSFRGGGDGGRDTTMLLCVNRSHVERVPVDVKVITYTGPVKYLKVPTCKWKPGVKLYVAGVFIEKPVHDVVLHGWCWGWEIGACPVMLFPPNTEDTYGKPFADLHKLSALERLVAKQETITMEGEMV